MKYCLAPMAELSTPALRKSVKNFSTDVVLYSEMMSAGAIRSGAHHNRSLSDIHEFDPPIISQLAGRDPAVMAEAAEILSEQNCDGIDINMACPAPDIVRKGCGAKLMTEPELARKIIIACRISVKKQLSVKIRSGFESFDEKYFVNFIKMLENEGVDLIAVHPRWAKLSFTRKADWQVVALAKKTLDIPVIGNGDINTPELALSRLREYGCDGIMIGREAVRSPWIFRLCSMLENDETSNLEIDLYETARRILSDIKNFLPENLHKSRGHRFAFYYAKNSLYSHELFKKIRPLSDPELMASVFKDYYTRNEKERFLNFMVENGTIIKN